MNNEELKSLELKLKETNGKKESKIRFTCTDRLNSTKTLEISFTSSDTLPVNKKIYNEVLIDKLQEFQIDANTLMTEFVDIEKKAIADNILSKNRFIIIFQK